MSLRLLPGDERFPRSLERTPFAAGPLYVLGDPTALLRPTVAVIGTRQATHAGMRLAFVVGELVAGEGFTVLSGLAVGCDGEAHRGCLSSGGRTVAVMAHGLERPVYPACHSQLARDAWGQGGALVSSYPDGTPPEPARFVERDSLQAALSLAVVLVESGPAGGSFHAIRAARELGRPVFALDSLAAGFRSGGLGRAVSEFRAIPVSSTGALRRHLAILVDPKGPRP